MDKSKSRRTVHDGIASMEEPEAPFSQTQQPARGRGAPSSSVP